MAWSPISPDGTLSVKSNLSVIGGNTTYIETTLGNSFNPGQDHYWNTGSPTEGRHRRINMNKFTSAQTPAGGMDTVTYAANIPDTSVICSRFNDGTTDWQLNAWQNVNRSTFTTAGTNLAYALVANLGNNIMGFIIIFSTLQQFAMSGQYVVDGVGNVNGWSNRSTQENGLNGASVSPLILKNVSGAPGELRVRVANNFPQFLNKTFNYVNFTRTI